MLKRCPRGNNDELGYFVSYIMNAILSLGTYLAAGFIGGWTCVKLKVPAGALVGSMLAVVVCKLIIQKSWPIPNGIAGYGKQKLGDPLDDF